MYRLFPSLFFVVAAWSAERRPMTPLDVIQLDRLGPQAVSPDGRWLLYARSIPNWEKGQNYTDLFLVRTDATEHRQMTFTREADETPMAWARDSASFAFLSAREGKQKQLYLMPIAGGEARKLTSEKDGVSSFAYSRDGRWLALLAGDEDHRELKLIDLSDPAFTVKTLLKHSTPVEHWLWRPAGDRIYFIAADRDESVHAKRRKLGFDVKVNALEQSPRNLWFVDIETKKETRLTALTDVHVQNPKVSLDGRYLAFTGKPVSRYATSWDQEVFLCDLQSAALRRVTENRQSEGGLEFSPDGKWLAYTLAEGAEEMRAERIHLAATDGSPGRKLLENWPYDGAVGAWSSSGDALYFASTVGVNQQLYRVPVTGGQPEPVTAGDHVLTASLDPDSGILLIRRSAPDQPEEIFTAAVAELGSRERWKRLSRMSEQIAQFQLGSYETIRWNSTDGTQVEGVLVKPVDYREGQRYPLIVQVHGGPAGTSTNSFGGSYGTYTHVLAGKGYAVFQPNYRGSTGYGEQFRRQIAGDYFRQGFDDIMSGVDYLISRGIADPDRLGHMGWSAGGHWSNWALTHTNRFKAIASGAGAVNWVSMYAQTDVQPVREFYFNGTPYDNTRHYQEVSPITYIKNARTPTLILCGTDDPRVPNAQSRELYIALQKAGVPVEYIEFPGMPHGITKPRYQFVKMVAELAWFDKWIGGKDAWIDWNEVVKTLPPQSGQESPGKPADTN